MQLGNMSQLDDVDGNRLQIRVMEFECIKNGVKSNPVSNRFRKSNSHSSFALSSYRLCLRL